LPCTRTPAASRPPGGSRSLGGRERAGLAEDVDPPGVRAHRVEHGAADEVDVGGAIALVLGGHDVRAEEGDLVGDLRGEARERLPATVRS
jgi:hypothetical protein